MTAALPMLPDRPMQPRVIAPLAASGERSPGVAPLVGTAAVVLETTLHMARTLSSRARARRFTVLELAVAWAVGGSVLAIAVPTFVREIHTSRMVEPVEGLKRIGAAAVAYAREHPVAQAFPPTVASTPGTPPRGKCEPDPPGAWDAPTWRALDFRPSPEGVPHCFSFSFESSLSATKSTFRAQAHADLDGDGIPSTFEITGHYAEGDPNGPVVDPGMVVASEVE